MNYHWIPEIDLYKIKVNKKGYNNIPSTNLNKKVIKRKNNSNSEGKMRKNNLHIKCIEENIAAFHKEGNILDDLINNKYLKPILESQDIDEKLLNCNLKEPLKSSFNVSLNDFFNRRQKYYINYKTPKLDKNQIRGLSIKTLNISNNNDYYNKNNIYISKIYNKTMENNNINNYYNDIQMTNNYYNNYNNNEINILNPFYNNIKINNLCSSLVRKKLKKYISNQNTNERNNSSNKISSPNSQFFKSQTYTQNEKNYTENYLRYKNNRIIRKNTNKEINIIDQANDNLENENDNINKKYNDIKNIIKNNNKYDYNKKLFDIYRGKLIKIFLRHIHKGIIKYLSNIFRFFLDQIQLYDEKYFKKIDEIFVPKIKLEKKNIDIIRNSINFVPYLQIFNSDKKKYQRYSNNNSKIIQYNRHRNKGNISNSVITIKRKIIENNNNIIKTNRNSMASSKTKNNIRILRMDSKNNNSIIYKKKKLDKNNMCIKKNKNDILNNSRGKIIDIDINLGKPIRDISDINPLESGFFMNDNKNINKKSKSSMSTNKRSKRKIKNKSKNKKLSLPKKKYLEEKYDISPESDFNFDNSNNFIDNSFEDKIINNNFTIKNNKNIIQPFLYKSSRITFTKKNSKQEKNILVNNIITSDKRLYINISYMSNTFFEDKLWNKKNYKNDSLMIWENFDFSFFGNKDKKVSNEKNKYLNSCVKFIIKNINKVFLKKFFEYFWKEYETKFKNNNFRENNNRNNKYRINTYKRKVGKNKI